MKNINLFFEVLLQKDTSSKNELVFDFCYYYFRYLFNSGNTFLYRHLSYFALLFMKWKSRSRCFSFLGVHISRHSKI